MRRVNHILLAVALVVSLIVGACHSPEPREGHDDSVDLPGLKVPLPDDDPTGDNRPSVGDGSSLRNELADAVPRFVQAGLTLRMDRGGVLFTLKTDGSWHIIDLDGSSRVEVDLKKCSLVVDGRTVNVASVTLLREYGGVSWYELESSPRAMLVVESL